MDARNNLANQEVFKMARGVDPRGDRTVGIITKCDVVQSGDEAGVGVYAKDLPKTTLELKSTVRLFALRRIALRTCSMGGSQSVTVLHPRSRPV